MKFFFRDQAPRLHRYLPEARSLPLSFSTTKGLPSRLIRQETGAPTNDLSDVDLGFLFRYEIFPRRILKFFGEWQRHGREMEPGDVIVQQVQVPPGWGSYFTFSVRILSVYREETRAGFSYGTLRGHPETGVNEFSFCLSDGVLSATIQTVAGLGHMLSRLLGPVFTWRYINWCNAQALSQMVNQFGIANPVARSTSGPHPTTL